MCLLFYSCLVLFIVAIRESVSFINTFIVFSIINLDFSYRLRASDFFSKCSWEKRGSRWNDNNWTRFAERSIAFERKDVIQLRRKIRSSIYQLNGTFFTRAYSRFAEAGSAGISLAWRQHLGVNIWRVTLVSWLYRPDERSASPPASASFRLKRTFMCYFVKLKGFRWPT